jgi:hypothetical protein
MIDLMEQDTAPPDTRWLTVERRVATEYARGRLAKALYEVVVDAVAFGPSDLPTPVDRDWIRGAMAAPIHEATNVALDSLAWRLGRALDLAPNQLLDRLAASHESAAFGPE